jgi:hypothetical protein
MEGEMTNEERALNLLASLFGMTVERLKAEYPLEDINADVTTIAAEFDAVQQDEAKWWAGTKHEARWAGGGCAACDRMAELEKVSVVSGQVQA